MEEKKKHRFDRQEESQDFQESLSHEQRKELISLMKKILPPTPSAALIDLRFSFWFIKKWYCIFMIGRDIRKDFRATSTNDNDRNLVFAAKFFTYLLMTIIFVIAVIALIYMLKSVLGWDIMPDKHFTDYLPFLRRFQVGQ
ncbi:MAG TPA: hypothetical protein PLE74_07750 [Candidatus Cloacimonadota bacterium]|nr:hypothetical protein [Candidatus Cloacimonadota bacterium]HPT72159.1 hypothetical protein [Candidatus Cloacimonadota bacterium]